MRTTSLITVPSLLLLGLSAACSGAEGRAADGAADGGAAVGVDAGFATVPTTNGSQRGAEDDTSDEEGGLSPVAGQDGGASQPSGLQGQVPSSKRTPEESGENPAEAAAPAPAVPSDPTMDTDGDGLTDVEEIHQFGTSPDVPDTDGDGFTDFDEVVTKAFDPESAIAKFNPRVADVPTLKVQLLSAPTIGVNHTESSTQSTTTETQRTASTTNAQTNNWGGSNSHAVEMTHTAGVEVGVSHEFGLLGGTTVNASLSYEFSHSTTNEQTVSWSKEQSNENTNALTQVEALEQEENVALNDGYMQVVVQLSNPGHIAYELTGLTLGAVTSDQLDPTSVNALGAMTYLSSGNANSFPQTVLRNGDMPITAPFSLAGIDLATTKQLLAGANIAITPTTGSLTGADGVDFGLADTNIQARTARLIIDYGPDQAVESHRVAVVTGRNQRTVSTAEVLSEYLRIPYETGSGQWRHGTETVPRATHEGLTNIRNVGVDDESSSYWIVTHTHSEDNGNRIVTKVHNLIAKSYDFGGIELAKGDVLHLVYVQDQDRDGLGRRAELLYGTDPTVADTDGDGLSDSEEVNGWEIQEGGGLLAVSSDPLRRDTDGDGDTDTEEKSAGTHPRVSNYVNTAPVLGTPLVSADGFRAELTLSLADAEDNLAQLTVDWGDGTVDVTADPQPGALGLTHQYQDAKEYEIAVTLADSDGLEAGATVGYSATLPSEGLLLHMAFDGDLSAQLGQALANSYSEEEYTGDRRGLGEKALDMYGDGNTGTFSLLSGENLAGLSASFTMGLWVKVIAGTFYGNDTRIAGQGNWFNLYANSTRDGVRFGILNGRFADDTQPQLSAQTPLTDGWHYYAGMVEQLAAGGSAVRLYRDGRLVDSREVPQVFVNPGACRFYVGNFPDGDLCDGVRADEFTGFHGYVDDLRVYDRALSESELALLAQER